MTTALNILFLVFLSVFLVQARKHPVHGRYTRHIEDYELSIPHKLTFTGDFVSFKIPHFYEFPLPDSHHRTKRSPTDSDAIHLGVHANSNLQHLMLWPNYGLVSPDLVIETVTPQTVQETKFHQLADQKLCFYTGQVKGVRKSRAAISTCDGLVGHLVLNNEVFFIEPLENNEPNEEGHHLHVVYKRDTPDEFDDYDILFYGRDMDKDRKCRANDKDEEENKLFEATLAHFKKRSLTNDTVDNQHFIETMIVCDKKFLDHHRDLNRERFILTAFNMASDYLHDASLGLQVDLTLVRLLYLEKSENDLDVAKSHDAKQTLTNFCKWQKKFNPKEGNPAHADIALLFTRQDTCSGSDCEIVGQSFIGTPCKKEKNCAYCEDNGLELGLNVVHQIGHLLGAYDDDPKISGCTSDDSSDNTPYIMSPKANLSAIRWSKCSKKSVKDLLSRGSGECLLNRPAPSPYLLKPVLPGVIYDWDSQCKLMVPGSSACPTQESESVLCEEMRCLNPTSENEAIKCFSLGNPPADGTKCDDNMWCFQGKCVKTGQRPQTVDGDWSEWSDWSSCTRTCGRGITYAIRECNNPPPANGGRYCDGDKVRYKICKADPCPENATSFRQKQCDAYSDVPDAEGKTHQYKAFLNPEAPCALWCTTKDGANEELNTVVKDGTRCKPGTKNVCVNGACWKVGCDNMLNSAAVEDACGTCNGDGTGCKIVKDTYSDLGDKDYTTVAVFPTGVKKIKIEELAPSENVIAITDKTEKKFYLNGKYTEQTDGLYKLGKVEGVYTHTAPNQEKLTIKGPLTEELVFKVLFLKKENVGYHYQYAEMNTEQFEEPKFHWEVGDMGDCSTRCGGGTQMARLYCVEQKAGLVSDNFCTDMDKPVQPTQHCNMHPCSTMWRPGKWGQCDACKGKPGVQKRGVECVQENPNPVGEAILVEDDRCPEPGPGTQKVCKSDKPCKNKRYVHHIPETHLGDVWVKMQPKPVKHAYKRDDGLAEVGKKHKIGETTTTEQIIPFGEFGATSKSTLPPLCNAEFKSTTILSKSEVKNIAETNFQVVNASRKSAKVNLPKEGYMLDKRKETSIKLFIYPLKKTESASKRNATFEDDKDLPDTRLEDLEEDKSKIKKYTGKEAAKMFKELVKEGRKQQENEQKQNTEASMTTKKTTLKI